VERTGRGDAGIRRSVAIPVAIPAVLLVAVLVAAVGALMLRGGPPPVGATEAPKPITVRILATGVEPAMVQVDPGATVVWVNRAGASRSILASDASFDSGALAEGERFQFAFTEPRTVTYSVVQAPGISGTVVVGDAPPPGPVPSPTPIAAPAPGATPDGFAYTGSSTAVNGAIGGLLLAFGAVLLYGAQRFGVVAAISRLSFSHGADDLLPSRRHRRLRKAEARRSRVRP